MAGVQSRIEILVQEGGAIPLQQQYRRSHAWCGRPQPLSQNSDLELTEHNRGAGPQGTDLVRPVQRCLGRLDGWRSSASSATRGERKIRGLDERLCRLDPVDSNQLRRTPIRARAPHPPISLRSRAFQATGTLEEIFKYTYTFQHMVCICFSALPGQTGNPFALFLRVLEEIRPICRLQAGPDSPTRAAWPRSPRWAWHSGASRAPHVRSHPGPT